MGNKVTLVNKKRSAGEKYWKNIVKIQVNTYLVIFYPLLHFLQLKAVIFFSWGQKKSRLSDRVTVYFSLWKIWMMTWRIGFCCIGWFLLCWCCWLHSILSFRYDSFGRLTNVTFPTGQVSSFRSDTDSSVHVQVETSSKDDVTITTNLSASGAFYTLLQGELGHRPSPDQAAHNGLPIRKQALSW